MILTRALSLPATIVARRRNQRGLPRMLTYTVTFACNARCTMCDSWRKAPEDELSLNEIEGIFRQLPAMDAVRLTGGEPFVRRDFASIVAMAQDILQPGMLHITTNGFLTEAIGSLCADRDPRKPLHVLVSLDGTAELHNDVRGRSFAWDRTWETLTLLVKHRKVWNLQLSVNQTIVDARGLEEYARLHALLKPIEVDHHVVVAYRESATYSTEKFLDIAPSQAGEYRPWGDLPRDELERFLEAAQRDLGELSTPNRVAKGYYLRGIANRLLRGLPSPNPPCAALHQHLRVFPNSDVPTCQLNSRAVGNLRRQTLAEVWESTAALEGAAWVRACAGCWAECEVLPSALYSGDLFALRR